MVRRSGGGLLLVVGGLLLAAVPSLLDRVATRRAGGPSAGSLGLFPRPLAQRAPAPRDPALRPVALLEAGLLERLARADRDWIPRAEPLPDGGTRYLYKRRPGDPELTIPEIQALIARPPSHAAEQATIVELLQLLDQAGASLQLSEPLRAGAAGEWAAGERLMRIRPDVIGKGSLEFARVLNHEAVHVAQSCHAGGLGANPRLLGLGGGGLDSAASRQAQAAPLQDPVYAAISPAERRMEDEAYALQDDLDSGKALIRRHCLADRSGSGG